MEYYETDIWKEMNADMRVFEVLLWCRDNTLAINEIETECALLKEVS